MTDALIRFTCSRCGTVYQVDSSLIGERGRIARCVVCNHRFAVRFIASAAAAERVEESVAEATAVEVYPEPPLFLEETPEEAIGIEEAEITQIREAPPLPDVELPIAPAPVEMPERRPLPDVEMPDRLGEPVGVALEEESTEIRRRWRDPMRPEKKKTSLFGLPKDSAQPTSGALYKVIIIAVGALAFVTSFFNLGAWRIDPLWSLTLIVIGIASFRMQSLSGLLVAGLFCFFYPLALFSRQVPAIVAGELTGLTVIAAQTAFAVVILLTYGILVARKGTLFVLREGTTQSVTAGILALLVLSLAAWAHLDSSMILSLGQISLGGPPLDSVTFYGSAQEYGVPISVLLQGWALSLAVAFGFSARAVRNRLLLLANLGLAIGFLALLLLYAPLVNYEIKLPFF